MHLFDTHGGAIFIYENRKATQDWCDAWKRRDLDAIMDHYSDDVEFSSPTRVSHIRARFLDKTKYKRDRLLWTVSGGSYPLRLALSQMDLKRELMPSRPSQ